MRNSLPALRKAHGWSQAGLGDRLGVSPQTVNALETGRYDPSLPLAFRASPGCSPGPSKPSSRSTRNVTRTLKTAQLFTRRDDMRR